LAEWHALDGSVKGVLKKLLQKRLEQPHVPGAELHGELRGCYKIKPD
jgi:mRNA interferase RelE/StbE